MSTINLSKIPLSFKYEDGIRLEANTFPGIPKGKYEFFIDFGKATISLVEITKHKKFNFNITLQADLQVETDEEKLEKFVENLPADEFFYGDVENLTKKQKKKALIEGLRKFRNQPGIPAKMITYDALTATLEKWLERDDDKEGFFHEVFGGNPDSDDFDQEVCDRAMSKIVKKAIEDSMKDMKEDNSCPGCGLEKKTGNFCDDCCQILVEDNNICPKCLASYGEDDDTRCKCTDPELERKQYTVEELGNLLIKQFSNRS